MSKDLFFVLKSTTRKVNSNLHGGWFMDFKNLIV